MKETVVFTSAANACGEMTLSAQASVDTSLPKQFPWLSISPVPARPSVALSDELGDEFALFADEVLEWAEQTLAVGLESWPDDWSDQ